MSKITQLNENTSLALTDLLPVVDDVGGTPVTQKVTIETLLEFIYPVGAIYCSVVNTSPATLFGGTWEAFSGGRVMVGINAGDADFDTSEETGGAKTHVLTSDEMPSHTHVVTDPGHTHVTQRYPTSTGANSGFTIDTSMSGTPADNTLTTKSATTGISNGNTGGGQSHNNMPPYIVVYMWKRTG